MGELIQIGEVVAPEDDGRLTLRIEKAYASLIDQLARECGATIIETEVDQAVDPDNILVFKIQLIDDRSEMLNNLQVKLHAHELTIRATKV